MVHLVPGAWCLVPGAENEMKGFGWAIGEGVELCRLARCGTYFLRFVLMFITSR